MNRTFAVLLPVIAVAFGVSVTATEKPTKEFQDLMKSNAAIVDLVGANNALGRDTNIDIARSDASAGPSLTLHTRAKDYDGIVKDAAMLKANFAKIEAFWTGRKVEDAINFSKTAANLASDLETAAKAKDSAGVVKAHAELANTCRACHLAHRVIMLTDQTFEIR